MRVFQIVIAVGCWVGAMHGLACQMANQAGQSIAGAPTVDASESEPNVSQDIVVCGERYSIGAPVVLWSDPGGYDAYSTDRHFDSEPAPKGGPEPGSLRFDPGRVARDGSRRQLVDPDSLDLAALGAVVDQFVLHYDVCGSSRQCFKILHDHRGLSVHFMLDIDGTLYQTVDLREQCWHATKANTRSIGIEIAHIGGRPKAALNQLKPWYVWDEIGVRIQLPAWMGDGGVRTQGFIGRPRRGERLEGPIQGGYQYMYDYTPEQYDTLVKLSAKLCELFPRMQPDGPRNESGELMRGVLSDEQFAEFGGILGHHHVQRNKVDPGVAFDWERFIGRVQQRLAGN